jgi:hypothetical protein
MKLQKSKKDRICDVCERKILKGDKYWGEYNKESVQMTRQEHTNCELFLDAKYADQ